MTPEISEATLTRAVSMLEREHDSRSRSRDWLRYGQTGGIGIVGVMLAFVLSSVDGIRGDMDRQQDLVSNVGTAVERVQQAQVEIRARLETYQGGVEAKLHEMDSRCELLRRDIGEMQQRMRGYEGRISVIEQRRLEEIGQHAPKSDAPRRPRRQEAE